MNKRRIYQIEYIYKSQSHAYHLGSAKNIFVCHKKGRGNLLQFRIRRHVENQCFRNCLCKEKFGNLSLRLKLYLEWFAYVPWQFVNEGYTAMNYYSNIVEFKHDNFCVPLNCYTMEWQQTVELLDFKSRECWISIQKLFARGTSSSGRNKDIIERFTDNILESGCVAKY